MACSRLVPHMSADGCKPAQNAGRSGLPKMRHRLSSPSWTHLTPAGLPFGIPGMGLVIDGAMQQAPQSGRQFMVAVYCLALASTTAEEEGAGLVL
jgi:hypothetical protein